MEPRRTVSLNARQIETSARLVGNQPKDFGKEHHA